jgi:hypothetical protein
MKELYFLCFPYQGVISRMVGNLGHIKYKRLKKLAGTRRVAVKFDLTAVPA